MMEQDPRCVPGGEQARVARALLQWLNAFGPVPKRVERIEAEFLSGRTCMGLFSAAAPFKTREFISGAYEAQYQFALQYRTAPASSEQRLRAMESLNTLAEWAEQGEVLPELGGGMRAVSVERSAPAVLAERYDDGSEDYQILMVMTYEVRPQSIDAT